jgi:hypothetical protein
VEIVTNKNKNKNNRNDKKYRNIENRDDFDVY